MRSQKGKEVRQRKSELELKEWAEKCGKGISAAWKENPERFMTEKRLEANKLNFQYERTPEIIQKINLSKITSVVNKMLENRVELTPENYDLQRAKMNVNAYPRYTKVFETWEELVKYFNLNHKVMKVERILLETTPVYDLSVKNFNNFLVSAGVILHNCKDFQFRFNWWSQVQGYSSASANEKAPYQNRFTWTNSQDDMGSTCKHGALVLSNLSWMMKVASVLNNYIHFAEENMQRQFAEIIFPKIYGTTYPKALQMGMFDRKYLQHSKGVIDAINDYGAKRGRFKAKPKEETDEEEVVFTQPKKQFNLFDYQKEQEEKESTQLQSQQQEQKPGFKPREEGEE